MAEEYEILPHQLLQDLKDDVEVLQKKLSKPDAKTNELILEIESLKDSVHDLTDVFRKALEEIRGEGDVTKTLQLLNEKLESVVSQNETIAKGMIAISDKVDAWMGANRGGIPAPRVSSVSHTMGMPQSHGPAKMAPRPGIPTPMPRASSGMDFPPPAAGKRKGLFK